MLTHRDLDLATLEGGHVHDQRFQVADEHLRRPLPEGLRDRLVESRLPALVEVIGQ